MLIFVTLGQRFSALIIELFTLCAICTLPALPFSELNVLFLSGGKKETSKIVHLLWKIQG